MKLYEEAADSAGHASKSDALRVCGEACGQSVHDLFSFQSRGTFSGAMNYTVSEMYQ